MQTARLDWLLETSETSLGLPVHLIFALAVKGGLSMAIKFAFNMHIIFSCQNYVTNCCGKILCMRPCTAMNN